jgi:GTP cyclohydrolase I
MAAAQVAARELFAALGLNLGEESLANTPARFASGLAELLTPREFDATTFPNDTGYRQLVIECNIPFRSLCEHHMLPFSSTAHVGYLPGPRILGLSKIARLVEHLAARPQVQERLTDQVADWLQTHLAPEGNRGDHEGRTHMHDVARCSRTGNPYRHVRVYRIAASLRRRTSRVHHHDRDELSQDGLAEHAEAPSAFRPLRTPKDQGASDHL